MEGMTADKTRVLAALAEAKVAGLSDYGRFVNDTTHAEPSHFDEVAAYFVFLHIFPSLTEPEALETVARYLGRHKDTDSAFLLLHDAYVRHSRTNKNLGWILGDSMATSGNLDKLDQILEVCLDPSYGETRQMVVYSLWRYKSDVRVRHALEQLVTDPDVSLHAMSAFRRTIGNIEALPLLLNVRDSHPDEIVRRHAKDAVRKIERALVRSKTS
jgi:hypothetical protein